MAVDGTYRVVIEALGKQAEGTVEVHEQGSKLIGTATVLGQTVPLENGKVSGNSFSGTMKADTPMGRTKLTVSGTVSGDTVEGTLKALLGKATFCGTRIA